MSLINNLFFVFLLLSITNFRTAGSVFLVNSSLFSLHFVLVFQEYMGITFEAIWAFLLQNTLFLSSITTLFHYKINEVKKKTHGGDWLKLNAVSLSWEFAICIETNLKRYKWEGTPFQIKRESSKWVNPVRSYRYAYIK